VPPFSQTVVKVGGSLFDWTDLPGRLHGFLVWQRLHAPRERAILLAGGGASVDVVRALDRTHELESARAHELALHALDLTARILESLVPGTIVVNRIVELDRAWNTELTPVLAPRESISNFVQSGHAPLLASWDVTSDTIAAWLAVALGADRLILLKSAPLPVFASRAEAARLGLVDPLLPESAQAIARVEYLNLRDGSMEPHLLPP
jgi:aspartokinase-like uncharacterized kinase